MKTGYPGWIFLGIFFLGTFAAPLKNTNNNLASAPIETKTPPVQKNVVLADEQSGDEMGAKIVAADAALGSATGEIRVAESGIISQPVLLSRNHSLVCVADGVKLTLSSLQASIIQQSNTSVRGCILSSSQTTVPAAGAEIFSQETSNVHVEHVTFIGGGYHIDYSNVSNFSIKNTRHISITAIATSPILIDSSTNGLISSPSIEGYIVPAGEFSVRLIGIHKSRFIDVQDPVIQGVDASTVTGCGGVSFTASSNSTLHGGVISGLKNCDGVLTESIGRAASSDIEVRGTVSSGHNATSGAGTNANNGEGFDIFNSKRVRLFKVTAHNDGTSPSNRQPGIEVSNSTQISIVHCISSGNGGDGIKIDGSPGVSIRESQTNHNGGVGILAMPALGRVSVVEGSSIVDWAPGDANMTFSAVWPPRTKIVIAGTVYAIASFQSGGRLTLASNFSAATGVYGYNVDSYTEIVGGEALDNGQLSAALPANQNVGQREGVYFAGGFSEELTGRVSGLRATDTQKRKTQTYGIRVENRARIMARTNSLAGNLAGGIRDSPGKSSIR